MVLDGVAVGWAAVEEDSPVVGVHAYVNPDTADAPILTLVSLQVIVPSDPALAVGVALSTVITTVSAVLEQPVDALVATKL